jgi:hypothetical protein
MRLLMGRTHPRSALHAAVATLQRELAAEFKEARRASSWIEASAPPLGSKLARLLLDRS